MPNSIALSPPPQLLQYIFDYLMDTPIASRKDLLEVSFSAWHPSYMVCYLSQAWHLGFSIAVRCSGWAPGWLAWLIQLLFCHTLDSTLLCHWSQKSCMCFSTSLPSYLDSIISGHQFVPAPPETQPSGPNVARNFNAMSLTTSETSSWIPFSLLHLELEEQYYWWLPVKPEVVFLRLMGHVVSLGPDCKEIILTQAIQNLLMLFKSNLTQDLLVHWGFSSGSSSDVGPSSNDLNDSKSRKQLVL